ncbi:hypothetical protein HDU96_006486 [Phlyctochytrium bullatum]|nr:hypothetical protein HDU96_006486 [Phlyctochytrium bullatum]
MSYHHHIHHIHHHHHHHHQPHPQEQQQPPKTTAIELPKQIVPPELSSFIASLVLKLWHHPSPTTLNRSHIHPLPPLLAAPPFSQTPSSFPQWVHRILATTNVPLSVVFLGLLFVHKMRSTVETPPQGSEFIVFVAALMVAMKSPQGCDNTYTNKGWHRISKVPLHLLNAMELQMLISLRFDMWVSEHNFSLWLHYIESAIALHMDRSNPAAVAVAAVSSTTTVPPVAPTSSPMPPPYPKRTVSLHVSTAATHTPSPTLSRPATPSTPSPTRRPQGHAVDPAVFEHTSARQGVPQRSTSRHAAVQACQRHHPSPPNSNFGSPYVEGVPVPPGQGGWTAQMQM